MKAGGALNCVPGCRNTPVPRGAGCVANESDHMLSEKEWWGLWPLESTFTGWVICFQTRKTWSWSSKATLGFAYGQPVCMFCIFRLRVFVRSVKHHCQLPQGCGGRGIHYVVAMGTVRRGLISAAQPFLGRGLSMSSGIWT